MSGIWSSELASRLPGTPTKELPAVVSDQPRSAAKQVPTQPLHTSPVTKEMAEYLKELDILLEYKLIADDPIPGVFLLPSSKTILEWFGILFIREGPWKGGVFHFTLYIPDEFPHMRPMVRFNSNVYHPYIHSHNGALNMTKTLPFWKPNKSHIRDVIAAVRNCFLQVECWSTDNDEQDKIMKEKIRACVLQSNKESIENGDPDNIFTSINNEQTIKLARQLIHKGELPQSDTDKASTSLLGKFTATVSQFIWSDSK
jgi:ubiquitin-protein ligase